MLRLTVLICTHNRAALLARTLFYLNQCLRPAGTKVEIVVVANARTDKTTELLEAYTAIPLELVELAGVEAATFDAASQALPLHRLVEPKPGKSQAPNRALAAIDTDTIAMVDDDHRVDRSYFAAIA